MGAGLIGCETAIQLSNDKDKDVTVVEMARYVMLGGGAPIAHPNLEYMERILPARENVHLMMRTMATSCSDTALTVNTKRVGTSELPYDTIVVSTGLAPVQGLYEELKDSMGNHVHLCGDANKVGTVMTAVRSATDIALAI